MPDSNDSTMEIDDEKKQAVGSRMIRAQSSQGLAEVAALPEPTFRLTKSKSLNSLSAEEKKIAQKRTAEAAELGEGGLGEGSVGIKPGGVGFGEVTGPDGARLRALLEEAQFKAAVVRYKTSEGSMESINDFFNSFKLEDYYYSNARGEATKVINTIKSLLGTESPSIEQALVTVDIATAVEANTQVKNENLNELKKQKIYLLIFIFKELLKTQFIKKETHTEAEKAAAAAAEEAEAVVNKAVNTEATVETTEVELGKLIEELDRIIKKLEYLKEQIKKLEDLKEQIKNVKIYLSIEKICTEYLKINMKLNRKLKRKLKEAEEASIEDYDLMSIF